MSRSCMWALCALLTTAAAATAQTPRFNVLHTFADPGGVNPNAPMIQATDGNFYGTNLQGGAADAGTLFKMTPAGSVTLLHTFFANSTDGGFPAAQLVQHTNGNLYGTTETGGNGSPGGTIFRLTLAGAYSVLYNLNGTSDGQDVYAPLTQASDGNLYGTALYGGANNAGTAFRITPAGTFTVLHSFVPAAEGANPYGGIVQGPDGNFYGTTYAGGASGKGTVFRMTSAGVVTVLKSFAGGSSDGAAPMAPLVNASDGNLYGLASAGGPANAGAAYRVTTAGVVTILHVFDPTTEASTPYGGFAQATDGNLYSTLFWGGSGGASGTGAVFRMTLAGSVTLIHSFLSTDGGSPFGGVFQGSDGSLYGTTGYGGAFDAGALFKVTLGGAYVLLQSLSGSNDGGHAIAPMIRATDGNLYGTGQAGGSSDGGVVFRITPAGVVSVIYSFNVHIEAGHPTAGLVQANDGNFYIGTGTTLMRLTPAGGRTVLHTLNSATEGVNPNTMVQAADGNLYGTTDTGGAASRGTIFKMALDGTFTLLYTFAGATDGMNPRSIIQAADGNFYGTTSRGGASNAGTVFRMTPGGTVTILHSFSAATEGSFPFGALIQASDGNLWGTTYSGGSAGGGTAWKMTTGGTFSVVHTFQAFEPYLIYAGLVEGPDGNFYGGGIGGAASYGGVFKMTPSGTVTTLHAFNGTDGSSPYPELTLAPGGHFYGTTTLGGPTTQFGAGVVFHLGPPKALTGDFDGDSKSEITTFTPGTGAWKLLKSSTGYTTSSTYSWGVSTDVPVVGDYDGDGLSDIAVFRPSNGTWYILKSSGNFTTFATYTWGAAGDKPVPGDYDGDGRTDIAVYRPSTGAWLVLQSSSNFTTSMSVTWGVATDVPVPADYDGDGRSDIAVFRPSSGVWWVLKSSAGFSTFVTYAWGAGGDIPMPGDYDGDGKADLAVYRPSTGTWWVLRSTTNNTTYLMVQWGVSTDVPIAGDFDGDGKADIVVYRPSTGMWFILRSSGSYTTYFTTTWGAGADIPLPKSPF